jgi:hypothetical protein
MAERSAAAGTLHLTSTVIRRSASAASPEMRFVAEALVGWM